MIRLVLVIMMATAASSAAMAEPLRHPITAPRIAAAITATGMAVKPEQVALLSGVVANTAEPQLRVRSIEMAAAGHALARLECEAGQCVPFVVRLSLPGSGIRPLKEQNASSPPPSAPTHDTGAPLIRRGSAATLVLNHGPVHISIPVTCLENGAPGESIRAVAAGSRQVYTAQVLNANVLTGRF